MKNVLDIICPKCGNNKSAITTIGNKKYGECTKCHYITYREGDKTISVKCPYCNSNNTRKISEATKVATVATFGVFGLSKATKEWHCNNCNSNF